MKTTRIFLLLFCIITFPLTLLAQDQREIAKKNLDQFNENWKTELQKYLNNGYGDLIRIQDQVFQEKIKQAKLDFNTNIIALKSVKTISNAQVKDFEVLANHEKSKISVLNKAKIDIDPSSIILKPEIIGIIPAPAQHQQNMIQLGGFVIIKGKNFGAVHGGVALKYQEEAKEFHQPPPPKMIELLPYENDWNRAWIDQLIIMKIPEDLPAENHVIPTGELIVYKSGTNSYKITYPISINFAGPSIHNIGASPEYADLETKVCAVSGGILTLQGKYLGEEPGRVFLSLMEPVNGKYELDLNILSWNDIGILVQIPKIQGLKGYQATMLTVQRKDKPEKNFWSNSIPFGPRILITNISGKNFLELAKNDIDDASIDHSPPVLKVSHDPACGWIGDDGNDSFFLNKKLPDGIKVKKIAFTRIDAGVALNTLKVLASELLDMFEAVSEGPVGIGKWFAEKSMNLFAGFVDSKTGSYTAIVQKYPSDNDNSVVIHWENTCYDWSNEKGLPIQYMITFVVVGPEDMIRSLKDELIIETSSSLSTNVLYQLKHKFSDKYVCAGQTENGGNVHQWGPIPSEQKERYQFQLVNAGEGYFYLIHQYSGKMVCAGDVKNGGNVHLWGPIPAGHQDRYKFKFEDAGNGYYRIMHKYSGKYICNGDKQNGGNIHLWGPIPKGHEDRYLFKLENFKNVF